MRDILIGCGQITWIRFTSNGRQWLAPEEQVLTEIAQAGYDGAPASPERDRSAQETIELYGRYGLRPAPGYIGTAFWNKERRDEILERVRRHASFSRAVGSTELYVAPGGFDYVTRSGRRRYELAGHVRPEDSLTDEEFQIFAETLNLAGAITLAEGVRSCFHNHVGTVIETREEVDRLLMLTDPDLVFLGPDTGHLAWAGADPVAFAATTPNVSRRCTSRTSLPPCEIVGGRPDGITAPSSSRASLSSSAKAVFPFRRSSPS